LGNASAIFRGARSFFLAGLVAPEPAFIDRLMGEPATAANHLPMMKNSPG
jgi:hypothetical protein